jgi:hypothetical protein
MIKPISLRLRHTDPVRQARAYLVEAGYRPELKRAHNAAQLRQARATVARAKEQRRLKNRAVLAAQKAIVEAREAFFHMEKLASTEFEQARWRASQAIVLDELEKIVQGRRP